MNKQTVRKRPSDLIILERASSFANEAMFTIDLQRRRLRSKEVEDSAFVFRWWVDLQFFIIALRRLRRSAELACRVPSVTPQVSAALKEFDDSLPALATMRNVGEHIDDYVLEKGHSKHIDGGMLQVGTWDGSTYEWLGEKMNVDVAHSAALRLYSALRSQTVQPTDGLKEEQRGNSNGW
jgi:hypothetical protein